MANLNRLKVVLDEQAKAGKWLTQKLGKSICTVSKSCSNSTQTDFYTLEKIAHLLGVDKSEPLTASDIKQNKI